MFVTGQETASREVEPLVSRKVLASGSSMMMVEVTFRKGGIGVVHYHDVHEQVSYIQKGSFRVTLGSESRVLVAGDSFYAEIGVPHGVEALEDAVILDVFTPIREDFL